MRLIGSSLFRRSDDPTNGASGACPLRVSTPPLPPFRRRREAEQLADKAFGVIPRLNDRELIVAAIESAIGGVREAIGSRKP